MSSILGMVAGQAGSAALGMAMSKWQDKRQLGMNQDLMNQQMVGNKSMMDYSYDKQMAMWKDTNYKAQMAEMKKAGLNPAMMYGMSGGGGGTVGSGGGSGVNSSSASGDGGGMMGMMMQSNLARMTAETDLLKAKTANEVAETPNKPLTGENIKADTVNKGVQKGNIEADTVNKAMNSIILEMTGKEASDVYKYKSEARGIESKTYQNELEARQGVAETIYDMWSSGKLEEKANAEVESAVLANAKSSEEIKNIKEAFKMIEQNVKGAKFSNVILELESKLQTKTGIDKSSAGWMKILGRLFVTLTGQ